MEEQKSFTMKLMSMAKQDIICKNPMVSSLDKVYTG